VVRRTLLAALALLAVAGCGTGHGDRPFAAPSPTDTEERIMSTTGDGFTICGVADTGPSTYRVVVCGDLAKARSVLDARFPGNTTAVAYQAGDGGGHTAQQLVAQFWIDRASGDGFKVTSTRITGSGTIEVGIDGDLGKARSALDRQFPGWTSVHAEQGSPAL
jgi:hypothetical protein